MTSVLIALSYWLHEMATVVFVGYFVLLAVICLPVLAKIEDRQALSGISKQSRLWLYASLLVFIVTGTYIMIVDPNYLGFANFGNFWGIVMLTKHILILGMIGMGFWYNAVMRVGPMMSSNNAVKQSIGRFRTYINVMAVSGVLVVLLTALAQVE